MKYTKFIIKNYKGIPEIELDLNKKPTSRIFTLVGLNESGKTSLLEAIYLFQNDISLDNAHTLIPKSQQYAFDEKISVMAELELSQSDFEQIKEHLENTHQYHLEDTRKIITVIQEYKFANSKPATDGFRMSYWDFNFTGKLKRSKKIKELSKEDNEEVWSEAVKYIKEKGLPRILYYPDFLFKFPEKIYLKKYGGESKEQEEYRKVVQDILSSIDDKSNLTIQDHLLERMENKSEPSNKNSLEQLLLKMESKLNNEILQKWDEIFKLKQNKEVKISDGEEKDKAGSIKYFIELKIKQGDSSYSINDRSLGFQWFFSFLIFTAFRNSRIDDPGDTLFLLDEPASNLHQSSQKKLLQSLEKIVLNCNLIYSTHSHHLIDPKWLAGTYIVRNKAINYESDEDSSTAETNISATLYKNFVAKYPKEEDYFKPILDSLDYTPSKLEMTPPIVFTEGKNDYYTLKYMLNVIFEDKYNLNFYPGAGVDKYEAPFRLYIAWDKKFIALFDSDEGGKKAKNNYIKNIEMDIENKIFTFEDIKPEWKNFETEKLFSKQDQVQVTQSCFSEDKKGDLKSKFNTAIQNLYIQKETFDFEQETRKNFEKVFNFLSEKIQ